MARFVGKMGENIVSAWAAEAGLVANRSADHDATGWDLLLEWPTMEHRAQGLPLDRRPSPRHCLVQVKSTDRTTKRCDVKLSNWERLIRTPLPTFFLILEFNGGDQCAAAFLIHVDEYHIRGTLRRLRDASLGERPLHKRFRAVSWGDKDRLGSPGGKSLELALRTHMRRSMDEYAAWKAKLLETAGYEEEAAELNVQFRALPSFSEQPQDILVRWGLGLIPYLEIDSAELTDIRFGIPSHSPVKTFPRGSLLGLRIQPFAEGEVRFLANGIRRHAILKAEVFLPTGVSHLVPENAIKVRIKTPFLDFLIGLTIHRLDFSLALPPLDDEQLLSELYGVASFILVRKEAHTLGIPVEIEFDIDTKPFRRGRLSSGGEPTEPLVEWARLIEHAWVTAKALDIDRDLRLSTGDLFSIRSELAVLYAILMPDPTEVYFSCWLGPIPDDQGTPWCLPLVVEAPLGDRIVQISAVAIGTLQPTGNVDRNQRQYEMTTSDVRIQQQRAYRRGDTFKLSKEELRAELVRRYDETMNVLDERSGLDESRIASDP